MCAIAGIISIVQTDNLKKDINSMLETVVHRGPDGQGSKIFDNKIVLGHRRLAILDLSEKGIQPMQRTGRYWITYNGEIYNYIELREELIKEGYAFSTDTDTEVLLAAYEKWGNDCVNHFNGMWAFAIYDEEKNQLFCSRDRYGVKPFYYSFSDNRFIFGSEIKEILAVFGKRPKVNRNTFDAYLVRGGFDKCEETMFDGIYQIEGGYNLILNCGDLTYKTVRWYDLRNIAVNKNDRHTNYRIFREKFLKAVNLRLRSDVPVGSCLSGGLDSSAIICAVHDNFKETKNDKGQYTVTSCFENERYDEWEYAESVIKKTGAASYQVFPDMGKIFEELDHIIWHMDEPFGGTSIYAQWCVFKEAKRRGLTVMLDGQGSDEQLAGYSAFYKVLFTQLLKKGKWKKLLHEIKCYKALREETEDLKTFDLVLSAITTLMMPNFLRYRLNTIYGRKKTGVPFSNAICNNAIVKSNFEGADKRNPQKYIYSGMNVGLRALLHFEDRNSMAHSIESRVPFLDYELAEFIYSIPFEQKIEDGRTKTILREALKDLLPEKIYNRYSKLGFATPEDVWLKENEEFFFDELGKACDKLSGIVEKNKVLKWYKDHIQATRRGDTTCFRIICASHWVEVFDVDLG